MRIGEKLGDVSLRLGRVDEAIAVWSECLDWHRGQEDLERVADLHRKIGAALSHKGERKAAIEHYQQGINLLKDGPPRLELVRLYEEAAWLYLHTGDNMLAIYASEKALRLAERLGETRAASRAHGIFGRVFGRIGDTEKARQNLERAVELARGSDDGETILALSALGRHLEISEADVTARAPPTRRRWRSPRRWARCPRRWSCTPALAQLAVYGADWEQVERSTEASAELAEREGLVGKLCLPYALRGLLRWREGPRRVHRAVPPRPRAGRAGRLVGDRLPGAVRAATRCATRATSRRAGRARPRARRLRARRADRAVDPGHRGAGRGAGAGAPPRGGREAAARLGAGRAPALPDRPRGGAGGRGVSAEDPLAGAELLAEAARPGASSTGRSRPPAAAAGRPGAGGPDAERGRASARRGGRRSSELGVPHLAERAATRRRA